MAPYARLGKLLNSRRQRGISEAAVVPNHDAFERTVPLPVVARNVHTDAQNGLSGVVYVDGDLSHIFGFSFEDVACGDVDHSCQISAGPAGVEDGIEDIECADVNLGAAQLADFRSATARDDEGPLPIAGSAPVDFGNATAADGAGFGDRGERQRGAARAGGGAGAALQCFGDRFAADVFKALDNARFVGLVVFGRDKPNGERVGTCWLACDAQVEGDRHRFPSQDFAGWRFLCDSYGRREGKPAREEGQPSDEGTGRRTANTRSGRLHHHGASIIRHPGVWCVWATDGRQAWASGYRSGATGISGFWVAAQRLLPKWERADMSEQKTIEEQAHEAGPPGPSVWVRLGTGVWTGAMVVGRGLTATWNAVDADVRRDLLRMPLLGLTVLGPRSVPIRALPRDGRRPLLFVHGLGGHRGNFLPMRTWFAGRHRRRSYSFGLPDDALPELGWRLAEAIEEVIAVNGLGEDGQVDVVAHSMGGVVARLALVDPQAARRVHTLVTLGTPHGGTQAARFAGSGRAKDLRPDSEVFSLIRAQVPWRANTRLVCLWSPADPLMQPATTAQVSGAINIEMDDMTHTQYLLDPRAWHQVRLALDA